MKLTRFLLLGGLLALLTSCSLTRNASPAPSQTVTRPAQPAVTQALTPPAAATATPIPPALPTTTPNPTTAESPSPASPTPAEEASPTVPSTPEATPAAPPAETAAPSPNASGCTDIAAYYGDLTIPDGTIFRQSETFLKIWRIRNEGTCTWDESYSLVFAGGEVMDAPLANSLSDVPPGTIAEISVELTAPTRGGTYQSNWEFQNPTGKRFGVGSGGLGQLWAQIAVSFVLPTDTSPPTSPQPAQSACTAARDTAVEAQVLASINNARQSQGLAPLEAQGQLSAAALAHSMDMACNNFVDHIGSDGSLWYDRVSAQGYDNYNSARENIYVGNPQFGGTAQGAFNWWWNSQIHHDNMLNPDVSQIGIAYVFNANSDYGGYYTTVFARP